MILYDPDETPRFQVLAQTNRWKRNLYPGQVNGEFVVWTRWRFRQDRYVDCEVYLHNLGTGATSRVPNPDDRCQFGASGGR